MVFVGPGFHSLLIESKNWLCLFGTGWQGLRSGRQVEEDDFGCFPLYLNDHIGLVLALLTVRFWWTSKNHKRGNITKHMRNEIWSSHVIIQSVSSKNFPASFILSKYTRGKHDHVVYPALFSFYCMKRKLAFQSLILANKSLPVTRHIKKKMFRHLKTKKWQRPHSNIWKATTQRKTLPIKKKKKKKEKVSLEILVLFWNSSHLSTPLNLSSRKKWQAMSHDGDAWLYKPLMRD